MRLGGLCPEIPTWEQQYRTKIAEQQACSYLQMCNAVASTALQTGHTQTIPLLRSRIRLELPRRVLIEKVQLMAYCRLLQSREIVSDKGERPVMYSNLFTYCQSMIAD